MCILPPFEKKSATFTRIVIIKPAAANETAITSAAATRTTEATSTAQ
jgi:hypothetical protein